MKLSTWINEIKRLVVSYSLWVIVIVILFLYYRIEFFIRLNLILTWFNSNYKNLLADKYFIAFIFGYILMGILSDILMNEYVLQIWERVRKSVKNANKEGAGIKTKFAQKWRSNFSWMPRRIGIIERLFYTTAIVFNQYGLIGLWIGLKAIGEWSDIRDNPKDKESKTQVTRIRANMFLIGTGISLFFGILGGLLFKTIIDPGYLLKQLR